jgi:hypothetical protein
MMVQLKIVSLLLALSFNGSVFGNLKHFINNFGGFNGLSFLKLASCDTTKCPSFPKHYEELECKAIIKDGECCPWRFEIK